MPLERCADEWAAGTRPKRSNAIKKLINRPEIPRGVYMYGGVGRARAFDGLFFQAVPCNARCACTFTSSCARCTASCGAAGHGQPAGRTGRQRIAKRYKLICFDEFHVADVTDAMILHRLLVALFDNGVGFVTTSNFKPDDLYPNGLHRDRILPAIALNERLEVVNVDNGTDYRRRTLERRAVSPRPLGRGRRRDEPAFDQLARVHDEDPVLRIEAREIHCARARPAAWCGSTSRRCAAGRARRTTIWRLPPVPHRAAVRCAACRSAWPRRRGASPGWWTCCTTDASSSSFRRRCRRGLYTDGPLAHEFPRTVHRAQRDAVKGIPAAERRVVDTGLT